MAPGSPTPSGKAEGRPRMDPRGAPERLKAWVVPSSCGGWVLTAFLLVVVLCMWAYSARDDLYKIYLGLQPGAQEVGKAAYVAGERLEMKNTASGARVTLNSVYAEEQYDIVGYEVEDLQEGRRVAGHPAELQPLLGFGYGKPTPREEKYLKKSGLGTDVVALTDESGTKFRMVDNSGETSEGPDNMVEGPLQNMVAFKPDQSLEPSEDHQFRLEIPLLESAVVPIEEKQLPPEPFPGKPFVFEFEVPVHPVQVVEVGQKETVSGVTLTLDRVINSLAVNQAVFCYEAPDDAHSWFLEGGKGTTRLALAGWSSSGSKKSVPRAECQELLLQGPLEGHSSVEVTMIQGEPDCRSVKAEAAKACNEKIGHKTIRGPWRFEFDASTT
jgi:hypothetical protein